MEKVGQASLLDQDQLYMDYGTAVDRVQTDRVEESLIPRVSFQKESLLDRSVESVQDISSNEVKTEAYKVNWKIAIPLLCLGIAPGLLYLIGVGIANCMGGRRVEKQLLNPPEKSLQGMKRGIIETLKRNSSCYQSMQLNDSKWERGLNMNVKVLGKDYKHDASEGEALSRAIESWAGNSPNKEALIRFAKTGITGHFFSSPYTEAEQPLMFDFMGEQMQQGKVPQDVFECTGFELIAGQKIQARFEYESEGKTCYFSQTFSLGSVEENSATIRIERSFS